MICKPLETIDSYNNVLGVSSYGKKLNLSCRSVVSLPGCQFFSLFKFIFLS